MIDINKEAEEYAKNNTEIPFYQVIFKHFFISGANSKHVQAKILQAQIDVYSDLLRQSDNHFAAICKYMIKQVELLQQQLKELENE